VAPHRCPCAGALAWEGQPARLGLRRLAARLRPSPALIVAIADDHGTPAIKDTGPTSRPHPEASKACSTPRHRDIIGLTHGGDTDFDLVGFKAHRQIVSCALPRPPAGAGILLLRPVQLVPLALKTFIRPGLTASDFPMNSANPEPLIPTSLPWCPLEKRPPT
jgi:hypothetical protein